MKRNNSNLFKCYMQLLMLIISTLFIFCCRTRKSDDNFIHTTPEIRELTYTHPKENMARKKPTILVGRIFYDGPEFYPDGQPVDVDFIPLSLGIDTIRFSERILKEFQFPSSCDNDETDKNIAFNISKGTLNNFEKIEIVKWGYCSEDIAEIMKNIISTYPILLQEKNISHFYLVLRIEYK